ncbi:hypothetical protein V8D89_015993 [Ganoderma adspersum]
MSAGSAISRLRSRDATADLVATSKFAMTRGSDNRPWPMRCLATVKHDLHEAVGARQISERQQVAGGLTGELRSERAGPPGTGKTLMDSGQPPRCPRRPYLQDAPNVSWSQNKPESHEESAEHETRLAYSHG